MRRRIAEAEKAAWNLNAPCAPDAASTRGLVAGKESMMKARRMITARSAARQIRATEERKESSAVADMSIEERPVKCSPPT
jgi:hypothetical protein